MVAMNCWPTDGAAGSVATEAKWRSMGRLWSVSGVARGVGGQLAPTLAFPNLTVQSGGCWVDGHYCELLSNQVLTATANGLAVVRFDPAANSADLLWRDAVSVPAQNPTGQWELPIAKTVGSVLSDLRVASVQPAGTFGNAFSGPPTTGLWTLGTTFSDKDNVVWTCTVGGTPGTWIVANQLLWKAYTPAWYYAGPPSSTNTIGNGTIAGRYMLVGKTCTFSVQITFGSTTTCGSGLISVGLPVPAALASGGAIAGSAWTFIPSLGQNYAGTPYFVPGNPDRVGTLFSISATNASASPWVVTTGAAGTGCPLVPGGFPVQPNGSFTLAGSYEAA